MKAFFAILALTALCINAEFRFRSRSARSATRTSEAEMLQSLSPSEYVQRVYRSRPDPVEYFKNYEARNPNDSIENRMVLIALRRLIRKYGESIEASDVVQCLANLEVCYRDEVTDNYFVEFFYRPELIRPINKIFPNHHLTCGDKFIVHPFETLFLMFNNSNDTECSIFVEMEKTHTPYFLDFIGQTSMEFGDCNENYLTIQQKGKQFVKEDYVDAIHTQKYCAGTFIMSELPEETDHALFTYVNKKPNERSSLLIQLSAQETEVPRKRHTQHYKQLPYTDVFPAHSSLAPSGGLKTFDPKYASYQTCAVECGTALSRWTKIPFLPEPTFDRIEESDFPWYVMVTINVDGVTSNFGGSVINSRTILTSASYLYELPYNADVSIETRPFSDIAIAVPRQSVRVSDIIVHPDFKRLTRAAERQNFRHDVAILHLEIPLRIGTEVVPVCLAPARDQWQGNLAQTIRPVESGEKPYLAESYSTLWYRNFCNSNQSTSSPEEVLCHSYHGNLDIVENPGSPVMVLMRNTWFQVGVLSQSFASTPMRTMLRYSSDVSHYMDFIDDNTVVEEGYCS